MAENNRFGEDFPSELQKRLDNAVPEATKKATKFDIKRFWATDSNQKWTFLMPGP